MKNKRTHNYTRDAAANAYLGDRFRRAETRSLRLEEYLDGTGG